MAPSPLPPQTAQAQAEKRASGKRSNRHRKSRYQLLRPIIDQVPAIYVATGFNSERTANDLGISRSDVLDLWNEHQWRKGPGQACTSCARLELVERRKA